MNHHPTDILIAILNRAFKQGERFNHNNKEWAKCLYEQREILPELSTVFALRPSQIEGIESTPQGECASPLENAYLNIHACGLISSIGFTSTHEAMPGLYASYDRFASRRTSDISTQLETIGQEFRKRFLLNR